MKAVAASALTRSRPLGILLAGPLSAGLLLVGCHESSLPADPQKATASERLQPQQPAAPAVPIMHTEAGLTWQDDPLVIAFLDQEIECPIGNASEGKGKALTATIKDYVRLEISQFAPLGQAEWRIRREEINGAPAITAESMSRIAAMEPNRDRRNGARR